MASTNVMRILDSKNIPYETYCYKDTNAISGIEVANVLNQNENQVFKTLVTISNTKKYYVFVIPVNKELNLKKAANFVSEKKIEMLKQKDLLNVTGYIHGGCSPIGMKKQFTTTINISATNFDSIIFSAGKIGYQVKISLDNLKQVIDYDLHDIVD